MFIKNYNIQKLNFFRVIDKSKFQQKPMF